MERPLVINGLRVKVKEHGNSYRIQLLFKNNDITKEEAEQLQIQFQGTIKKTIKNCQFLTILNNFLTIKKLTNLWKSK